MFAKGKQLIQGEMDNFQKFNLPNIATRAYWVI
jgi:hypothetical protein